MAIEGWMHRRECVVGDGGGGGGGVVDTFCRRLEWECSSAAGSRARALACPAILTLALGSLVTCEEAMRA